MPEYLSPGVYVEEIDLGAKPIAGISTSTAGFVGVTERGPSGAGKPIFVSSIGDFQSKFGGFLGKEGKQANGTPFEWGDHRWLPLSVHGFFLNGGQRCYIKRVVPKDAAKASLKLYAGVVTGLSESVVDDATTTLALRSMRGIEVGTQLKIREITGAGAASPKEDLVAVTGFSADGKKVTIAFTGGATKLKAKYKASNCVVTHSTLEPDETSDPLIEVSALNEGYWGNKVSVSVAPAMAGASSFLALPASLALAVGAADAGETDVTLADASDVAVGDTLEFTDPQGNQELLKVTAINGNDVTLHKPTGHDYSVGGTVRNVTAIRTSGTKVAVAAARPFYVGAVVELDNGTVKEYRRVTQVAGNVITLNSAVTRPYIQGGGHAMRCWELSMSVASDGLVEEFGGLSLDPEAPGYILNKVNADTSTLVEIKAVTPSVNLAAFPALKARLAAPMTGGSDGSAPPDPMAYVGEDNGPGSRTGLQALQEAEDISIALMPGITAEPIQGALINHCELLRYRFAILDGVMPKATPTVLQTIQEHKNQYDSKYAALYTPWLKVFDPATGTEVVCPPSGFVAGIYARSDSTVGVHKAPANEVVRGATGLNLELGKAEQDILNPIGVNVIRSFTGRGIRVWGARTVSSDPSWNYVNVRRLFIFLEASIDRATQWAVFEPNDVSLWERLRGSLTGFLTTAWRNGMLQGTKAEEAFFVRVGKGETMTQDDIDNGRLIVMIGAAPVKPAEFVIFRITQMPKGSSVSE
jgi:uncharacterized protein